jgi:hypothetical protein
LKFEPIRLYCTYVRASRLFLGWPRLGTAAIHPFLFLLHKTRISVYSCPHPTLGYDTRRVGPEWKRNPTSAALRIGCPPSKRGSRGRDGRATGKYGSAPLLRARCYASLSSCRVSSTSWSKLDCCFLCGATRRRLRVLLVRPRHGPETVTPCAHVGPAPQKFQRLQATLQQVPIVTIKCTSIQEEHVAAYCGRKLQEPTRFGVRASKNHQI